MRKRLKQKIEHWRQQPEDRRLRTARMLTWGAGVVVVLVWATVLLPIQLAFDNDESPAAVQGTITAPPTFSPTPSPTL